MPTADYARQVETTMGSISASEEIHPDNQEVIREFKRDLSLDGKSDARIQKVTSHLKIIAEHAGDTPFTEMDLGDIKDLVEWIHGRDIAETTQADYKKVIKQFWKWLEGENGEYPDKVDWITTTGPSSNGTLPKDLLTREDVDALKDACKNKRDRAFIAILYETGARIGELIDLTVGDIEDHTHGRKIVIDGKTGQRRLPLIESVPALNKWLNEHPSGEPDAPLWCQLQKDEQLSYHYIRQKLLERPAKRAGIEKPMNPHHFRHSRATELAQEFKEAELCEWFGWVQGSNVPGKYVHLSGRDIDSSYFKHHDIEEEDEEEDKNQVQECPRCDELNESDDQYCSRCGFALSEEARDKQAELREDVDREKEEADTMDLLEAVDKIQRIQEQNPELLEEVDL